MKPTRSAERGQVLIILVFAIIALIGITGLAVDGGNIYSDRRHAQNAADAAALHAAVVRTNLEKAVLGANKGDCSNIPVPPPLGGYGSCGSMIVNEAKQQATINGYDNDQVGNRVDVYTPPIDGPYSPAHCSGSCNPANYIQVVIATNVDTFFARVLGITQLHNRVEAVALAQYSPEHALFGGESLVVLRPTSTACPGDFTLGGNGTVTLKGGGIFVNSDNSSCAFKETSSCVELILEPLTSGGAIPGVQVYGGTSQFFSSCTNHPTLTQPTEPYPWIPESPLFADGEQPSQCTQVPLPEHVIAGVSHYYPGHYAMLPPDKNVVLEPGVYCVDNVIKTTNPTTFKGDDVFMYIKPGGSFDFQGGNVQLTAMTTGRYAGYLIYVDTDFSGTPKNCVINGNTSDKFTGVIYAPYCDVQINGGSSPTGITAQIISYTMTLNGSSNLTFIYDESKMPKVPEISRTGLFH